MNGARLHEYDLCLCNYALGNIRQSIGEKRFARAAKRELPAEMLRHFADLEVAGDDDGWMLLNDQEFLDLADACDEAPELNRKWVPYEALHRRRVECVKEIRDELTRQDAEDWSRACAAFAERLERKGVRLVDGLRIVHEWVRHLRRLIRAMGATDFLPRPEGPLPTPTAPPAATPAAPAAPALPLDVDQMDDVCRMRQAIRDTPDGRHAKTKTLVVKAGINKSKGLKALDWLKENGEYEGFVR